MKCLKCKKKIPDNSVFCPYCGWEVSMPEENETEQIDEKKELTENQRFYDKDYGYSEVNPIVVSSVAMIGNYLSSLRNETGDSFTWEFEATDTGTNVKKYNLFVNGSFYKSIFFNPNGNDSEYVPAGLVLDKEALEASIKGVSVEELKQKKEQEREAERVEKEKIAEKKIRSKKTVKVIAIIAAASLVLAGGAVALVLNRDNIKYAVANGKMNGGSYDEAISVFEDLGEFKDSKDLINECNYRKAEQLLDGGDIESAGILFESLGGYKDSKDKKQECDYLKAEQLFENGDFEGAAEAFDKLTTYKDSKNRRNECLYNQANKLFADGKYEESLELFEQIREEFDVDSKILDCNYYLSKRYYENKEFDKSYNSYLNLKNNNDIEYDLSFVDDLILNYAKQLINGKDNKGCEKAVDLLNGNESEEAKELIAQANAQIKKNQYDSAVSQLKSKHYLKAIIAFENLSGYLDSDEKRLEAMYEYVQLRTEPMNEYLDYAYYNYYSDSAYDEYEFLYKPAFDFDGDHVGEYFYKYAKELSDLNYKNSKEVYGELVKWRVGMFINDEEDSLEEQNSISRSEIFYCHIKVRGGEFNETTTLQYRITMPSGQVMTDVFEDVYSGYTGYCCAYYNDWVNGQTGTCSFEILDLSGEVLAQGQVRIIY